MNIKKALKQSLNNDSAVLSFMLYLYNHLPGNNSCHLHGCKLSIKSSQLKNCKIDVHGTNNSIIIHKGCILKNCQITIHGNGNTVELFSFVIGNQADFYIEDDNNSIVVGEHTDFAGKIHLACTEGCGIYIGKDCLFSSEIVIRTGDSHSIIDLNGKRINKSSDVHINDHVWVGHRVCINKGAAVAANSVIGTAAVITKQFFDANVVIAGVPAKIIKENINWRSERLPTTEE